MNYKQAMKYLCLTHVVEPTYADPDTEDALGVLGETIADLRAALEELLEVSENPPMLNEDEDFHALYTKRVEMAEEQARAALAEEKERGEK